MSFVDLSSRTKLFSNSLALQTAASALERGLKGEQVSRQDKYALVWAGRLMTQMDFSCKYRGDAGFRDISLDAVSLAKFYYGALVEKKVMLENRFAERVWKAFTSDYPVQNLPKGDVSKAQSILQYMATNTLIQLNEGSGQI